MPVPERVLKPRLIRKAAPNNGGWEAHVTVKLTPSKGSTSHPLMRGVWQKPRKDPVPAAPSDDDAPASPTTLQGQQQQNVVHI